MHVHILDLQLFIRNSASIFPYFFFYILISKMIKVNKGPPA